MWITIMGSIGAGKTTLAKMLNKHYGWSVKYEAVDNNPYLEDFYNDMNRWAFESQIFFMNKKLEDILEIKEHPEKIYIQDRSIFEDRYMFVPTLYEQHHLDAREYENYSDLYKSISRLVGFPDLLIYIRSSIGNLTTQIAKRGSEMESNISISYLQKLNEKYEDFVNNYKGKMIIIDGDSVKFENRKTDFQMVTDLIDNTINDPK